MEEREHNEKEFRVYSDDEFTRIQINKNTSIDLDLLKEMCRSVKNAGDVRPLIIVLEPHMNLRKEVRDYIFKINKRYSVPPVAVIAETFNEVLMANFYKKFYKPQTPYEIFKKEKEAFNWLRENIK